MAYTVLPHSPRQGGLQVNVSATVTAKFTTTEDRVTATFVVVEVGLLLPLFLSPHPFHRQPPSLSLLSRHRYSTTSRMKSHQIQKTKITIHLNRELASRQNTQAPTPLSVTTNILILPASRCIDPLSLSPPTPSFTHPPTPKPPPPPPPSQPLPHRLHCFVNHPPSLSSPLVITAIGGYCCPSSPPPFHLIILHHHHLPHTIPHFHCINHPKTTTTNPWLLVLATDYYPLLAATTGSID
jgi:hypothetical protein